MRVITVNVNGIRAAARKGFFDWLAKQKADVVCIQETKAQQHQLVDPVFYPKGYYHYYVDAEKKGYSGVALYCRQQPDNVTTKIGWQRGADDEGRYVQADFGKLSVASIYLPSGSSGDHRQVMKFDFLDRYLPLLKKQIKQQRHYILCGDWNIAHKQIDLKNWRANQKNSGFLPEERAWLDTIFDLGWVDAFRAIDQRADQYTWWSNRGQAWANNVGWRIDYQIVSKHLKDKVQKASIYKTERFSDHAPLLMDYTL